MNDISETIISRLIRMEEKLDGYLFRTTRVESKSDEHDTRIRALEMGNIKLLTGAGVLAFIVATLGEGIVHMLH
jgi:hypothetical protein